MASSTRSPYTACKVGAATPPSTASSLRERRPLFTSVRSTLSGHHNAMFLELASCVGRFLPLPREPRSAAVAWHNLRKSSHRDVRPCPQDPDPRRHHISCGRNRRRLPPMSRDLAPYTPTPSFVERPNDSDDENVFSLPENHGVVVCEKRIWCPQWQLKKEIAPWPALPKMIWEGDDRAKTTVGRFLPLPPEPGSAAGFLWRLTDGVLSFHNVPAGNSLYPGPDGILATTYQSPATALGQMTADQVSD
ncbi:uncharacterized protein BDZ99DRAFT_545500 [Mytilinidion resinicola]|uniref:Uncharacterized protein n=1 Tax=Mytilinidion resinicola TaxID=574789 RepID=A0A6A6Y6F7_9PEZI|nr:uncharacterized protein BDZ99DRAFT_545500 [Mytilinidion resinicola]KAF2804270.1 hypothetical protein BDZ99DRAFT_545500 [Mytilinidion resinicola]